MAQVTSPIILDSTGQQIHSDLQQIKNVLTTPSTAADITFDNTGTGMQADDVQDAITELKSNLTDLNTKTTLYDDDNILLIKRGYTYCLTMFGVTYSDFQKALTTIQQYFPETASFSLVSDLQGKRYLAPAFISNNSVTIQIVGTYNSNPTNWASATSHIVYGTMTWIR